MYARSTTIQAQPLSVDIGIAHVRDVVMPALKEIDGFVGLSLLVDRQSGTCIATSSWDTIEAMRAGKLEVVKPDARVFHHVIAEMGGEDSKAIMIGDSATDVATARAAGVPVIVLSYGYTPEPAQTLGADRVTSNFRDIPRLVQELLGS